jgi:transcriptional regulator of acetoin/glycerol metabolism
VRYSCGVPANITRIPRQSPTPDAVRAVLARSGGSVTEAALMLGVHRTTLHRLMRRYGIEIKRITA